MVSQRVPSELLVPQLIHVAIKEGCPAYEKFPQRGTPGSISLSPSHRGRMIRLSLASLLSSLASQPFKESSALPSLDAEKVVGVRRVEVTQ